MECVASSSWSAPTNRSTCRTGSQAAAFAYGSWLAACAPRPSTASMFVCGTRAHVPGRMDAATRPSAASPAAPAGTSAETSRATASAPLIPREMPAGAKSVPSRLLRHRHARALRHVDLQLRVGRAHLALREAELGADDVRAPRERGRLVERDRPRHALAAEAAVGREHEVLRVDDLEPAAHVAGDLLGRLHVQGAVADEADGDLLLQVALVRREELERLVVRVLRLDRPDVSLEPVEVDV